MTITFQKRQKEMKRLEKQKAKEERRAQKKVEKRARLNDGTTESTTPVTNDSEPTPEN